MTDAAPKMILFHNDCDWVVAVNPEDATNLLGEHNGGGVLDLDEFQTEWEAWGEDRPLTIDDDGTKITLTGAEWATRGRAYLGSTEH